MHGQPRALPGSRTAIDTLRLTREEGELPTARVSPDSLRGLHTSGAGLRTAQLSAGVATDPQPSGAGGTATARGFGDGQRSQALPRRVQLCPCQAGGCPQAPQLAPNAPSWRQRGRSCPQDPRAQASPGDSTERTLAAQTRLLAQAVPAGRARAVPGVQMGGGRFNYSFCQHCNYSGLSLASGEG